MPGIIEDPMTLSISETFDGRRRRHSALHQSCQKGVENQVKRLLAVSILTLSLFGFPAHGQNQTRALPDDNLAYPVLITIKNGTGSGFYVNNNNTAIYLVTAKHVLFDLTTGKLLDTTVEMLSYSKDLSDTTPNSFTVDTAVLGVNNIITHPSQDIALLKIASVKSLSVNNVNQYEMFVLPGVTKHTSAKAGILSVARDTIKTFNEVLTGNEVIVLGYPTSLGLQTMPQIDSHRPLLRKGIVAGLNPQTRSIILDCPVYFGNSGGPVIEVDPEVSGHRFRIIGVINQYVPYADGGKTFFIMANSGYSVATPMDYVLELIK
jgi:S1-C subfamily serine protease